MLGPDRFGNSSIEKVVATTNNSKLLDLTARKLNRSQPLLLRRAGNRCTSSYNPVNCSMVLR